MVLNKLQLEKMQSTSICAHLTFTTWLLVNLGAIFTAIEVWLNLHHVLGQKMSQARQRKKTAFWST